MLKRLTRSLLPSNAKRGRRFQIQKLTSTKQSLTNTRSRVLQYFLGHSQQQQATEASSSEKLYGSSADPMPCAPLTSSSDLSVTEASDMRIQVSDT